MGSMFVNQKDKKKVNRMWKKCHAPNAALPVLGALYSPLTTSREGKEMLK